MGVAAGFRILNFPIDVRLVAWSTSTIAEDRMITQLPGFESGGNSAQTIAWRPL